ncbi:hypothetical protein NQ315_011801 [Exocentrus adspersus]|uniref:Uncharacterized protein n=1 Tax=Exocentrus adspersus TaxID=1586481 RepID=A0AAV8W1N6_9CUCU|nr:hypothetical protein NQ315_011801 [Exocentrus adspersus]
MKIAILWLCFLHLLILASAERTLDPLDNHEQLADKISEHFYYKCYNQTKDLKVFQKLSNDVSQFMRYLEYTFTFIPDRKQIFCDSERKQLDLRIREITGDLRPCLSAQEAFLGDFIETSFREFTHFMCHNNGENIDILFSSRHRQCKAYMEEDNTSSDTYYCFGKMFRPLSGYITKKELCDDITVARKCMATTIDIKCNAPDAYMDLNTRFFDYISKPCSGCTSQVSILLLALSVALAYLFGKN